ncbi:MAG: hypothetical protein KGL39_33690 [Patescibacteria group bacterium]|nr:hypothetical protein [Patescibacteria group bacterium]
MKTETIKLAPRGVSKITAKWRNGAIEIFVNVKKNCVSKMNRNLEEFSFIGKDSSEHSMIAKPIRFLWISGFGLGVEAEWTGSARPKRNEALCLCFRSDLNFSKIESFQNPRSRARGSRLNPSEIIGCNIGCVGYFDRHPSFKF